MNIFIEVNNYCELKCRFCIADLGYKYPSTNISTELIDEIINTDLKLKSTSANGRILVEKLIAKLSLIAKEISYAKN